MGGLVGEPESGGVLEAVVGGEALRLYGDFVGFPLGVDESGIGEEGGAENGRRGGEVEAVRFQLRVPGGVHGKDLLEAVGLVCFAEGEGDGGGIGVGAGCVGVAFVGDSVERLGIGLDEDVVEACEAGAGGGHGEVGFRAGEGDVDGRFGGHAVEGHQFPDGGQRAGHEAVAAGGNGEGAEGDEIELAHRAVAQAGVEELEVVVGDGDAGARLRVRLAGGFLGEGEPLHVFEGRV